MGEELGLPASVRKDFIDLTTVGPMGDLYAPPQGATLGEFVDLTGVGIPHRLAPLGVHTAGGRAADIMMSAVYIDVFGILEENFPNLTETQIEELLEELRGQARRRIHSAFMKAEGYLTELDKVMANANADEDLAYEDFIDLIDFLAGILVGTVAKAVRKGLLGFAADVLSNWANTTATKIYNAPKLAEMFVTAKKRWKVDYWETMKENLPGIETDEAEDRDIRGKEERGLFDAIYREEMKKALERRWVDKQ